MSKSKFPLGLTAVMLPELDFDEQIALCNEVGITHYSVRPRVIPEDQRDAAPGNWGRHHFDLTPDRLLKEGKDIAAKLAAGGLTPFGTVSHASITQTEDELKVHFEGAKLVGAGRLRMAPRPYPMNEVLDYDKLLKETIEGYKRAVEIGRPYGQKIVIETHCRSLAASPALALNICREFDPAELGVIFDIANFNIEGGLRPNMAVAVMGDYIDHVHIGGSQRISTDTDANGFDVPAYRMAAMTQSNLYLPDWVKALHEAGRHVPLLIEDYTPNMSGAARLRRSAADLKRMVENITG